MPLHQRVIDNIAEAGQRPDMQRAGSIQPAAGQLRKIMDADQPAAGQLAFANADQHIRTAGNHHCLGVGNQGGDRILHACGAVDRF